jgi:hypothetical protein
MVFFGSIDFISISLFLIFKKFMFHIFLTKKSCVFFDCFIFFSSVKKIPSHFLALFFSLKILIFKSIFAAVSRTSTKAEKPCFVRMLFWKL